MPWNESDAFRHTHKATTPKSKRAFSNAANSVLESTGDEGRAVRAGNAAAAHSVEKSHDETRRYGGRKSRR